MWNAVHIATISLINSMTARLSTKKKADETVAGIGAAATAGSSGDVVSPPSDILDRNLSESNEDQTMLRVYIPVLLPVTL